MCKMKAQIDLHLQKNLLRNQIVKIDNDRNQPTTCTKQIGFSTLPSLNYKIGRNSGRKRLPVHSTQWITVPAREPPLATHASQELALATGPLPKLTCKLFSLSDSQEMNSQLSPDGMG